MFNFWNYEFNVVSECVFVPIIPCGAFFFHDYSFAVFKRFIKWFLLFSKESIFAFKTHFWEHNSFISAFFSTSSISSICCWRISNSLFNFTSSLVMFSSSSLNFCFFSSCILSNQCDKKRRPEGLKYQTKHSWLTERERASKYQAWKQVVFSEFVCFNINDSMRHGFSCLFPFCFFHHEHWRSLFPSLK